MRSTSLFILFLVSSISRANNSDTTNSQQFINFFKQGHVSGQVRNFSMTTINEGNLKDYYANAIGASIQYHTGNWKGFNVGLKGIFVYKTFSNNLLEIDSSAGSSSNYESQLFDVEQPGNYTDLDRLEELYISYDHKGLNTKFGKMEIRTPIVNKHDGRMKPKVFLGGKIEYSSNNLDLFGGWFWKASPRSITHWYDIGDAIGLYNNGLLEDGTTADYHHHISSKGLGIIGAEYCIKSRFGIKVWDYFIENVSNTSFIDLSYSDSTLYFGFMYLNQFGLNEGGNDMINHTYFHPSITTHAVSTRLAYTHRKHTLQLNGTHVFDGGKFIFPREFGMDPFYTFIARSQIEGAGNASALTLGYIYNFKGWNLGVQWNRMMLLNDHRHNKYNIPSYDQFNLDLNYRFSKKLEGLEMRFLYVFRNSIWNDITPDQTFNKVNFHHLNLVFNFNF